MKELIEKLKIYFQSKVKLTEYNTAISKQFYDMSLELSELKCKKIGAIDVIKQIIDGLNWYDFMELPDDARKIYRGNANNVVANETYLNERQTIISDLIKTVASKEVGPQELRDIQMTINGIELFHQRLLEISAPEPEPKPVKEPNAII